MNKNIKGNQVKIKLLIGLTTYLKGKQKKEYYFNLDKLEKPTVKTLLKKMAGMYGSDFIEAVFDEEEDLDPALLIIINHKIISRNEAYDIKLKGGDVIKLGITASGG